jgi:hypothetical protein
VSCGWGLSCYNAELFGKVCIESVVKDSKKLLNFLLKKLVSLLPTMPLDFRDMLYSL